MTRTAPTPVTQTTTDATRRITGALETLAHQGHDQVMALSQEPMNKSSEVWLKSVNEMSAMSLSSLNYMHRFTTLALENMATTCLEIGTYQRSALDKTLATSTKMLESRSPEEWIALQARFTTDIVDDALALANRLAALPRDLEAQTSPSQPEAKSSVFTLTRSTPS